MDDVSYLDPVAETLNLFVARVRGCRSGGSWVYLMRCGKCGVGMQPMGRGLCRDCSASIPLSMPGGKPDHRAILRIVRSLLLWGGSDVTGQQDESAIIHQ